MQMLQGIDHAGNVVEVLCGGFAVGTGLGIHHVNRSAGSAEVDLVTPGFHVVFGVLGVQHEVARGIGHRVFHKRAREEQASGVGQGGAGLDHGVNPALWRVGKTDGFQCIKCGMVNFQDIGVAQGLVATTAHAWAHRLEVVRQCR